MGIKKMLHLIWSNATSEDSKELKGVRSRLLECYRSLYLDPLPDMEPKQQVSRKMFIIVLMSISFAG
jgi:condensin complex subunit 1